MQRFVPFDGWAYSLLLGLYLGDGCVSSTGRSYQLRVVLDGLYPEVIDDCVMAITLSLRKEVNVHVRPRRTDRGVIVEAAYKHWPLVFPQHGPGRKHNRAIVLHEWQRAIVDRRPEPFLRGLIHSDGCRTVNRFKTEAPERPRRRVRLSALLLLQPVRRHPRPVLRVLRAARDSLDAVEPAQHLGVAP